MHINLWQQTKWQCQCGKDRVRFCISQTTTQNYRNRIASHRIAIILCVCLCLHFLNSFYSCQRAEIVITIQFDSGLDVSFSLSIFLCLPDSESVCSSTMWNWHCENHVINRCVHMIESRMLLFFLLLLLFQWNQIPSTEHIKEFCRRPTDRASNSFFLSPFFSISNACLSEHTLPLVIICNNRIFYAFILWFQIFDISIIFKRICK